MMDKITLDRIQTAHPKLRDELYLIFVEINERLTGSAKARFTSVFRTIEEQNKLYQQGRNLPGKVVTMARGYESYHNYGLAVDVCLIVNEKELSWSLTNDYDKDGMADFMEVVFVFKKHGWEWAGEWKTFREYPHFQKTLGKGLPELKKLLLESKVQYPVL